MRFDFHTHGKLSKGFDFSLDFYINMAKHALESGLDAVALTEHFNTKNFKEVYDTLDENFPYEDGYYNVLGLKVFPGMEVDIQEVGHILCIGDRVDVRALRASLDNYTEEGRFVPFEKLLNFVSMYDMLVIGAHPFRPSTPLLGIEPILLQQLDAFDLNGKDLHTRGIDENISDVFSFAEELYKPVVGGSDTHHYKQFGAVYTVLEKPCSTIKELKQIISNGEFTVETAEDLHERVSEAVRLKKIEKAKLELENAK
ncbi:PHP-associated domain-containing protein [Bacillus sp. JJ1521]|uniref:PHP-associated domain-containing protein n=1 Tax=Bacillus sp. JJ1521 TaxID=3122957 RepID=UPI002FFF35B2